MPPLLSSLCEKSETFLGGYKFSGTLKEREEKIRILGFDTCRLLSFQVLFRSGVVALYAGSVLNVRHIRCNFDQVIIAFVEAALEMGTCIWSDGSDLIHCYMCKAPI